MGIGINDCAHPRIPKLGDAVNDVRAVERALRANLWPRITSFENLYEASRRALLPPTNQVPTRRGAASSFRSAIVER